MVTEQYDDQWQQAESAQRRMEALVDLAYERFVRESNFDFRDYLTDEENAAYEADQELCERMDQLATEEAAEENSAQAREDGDAQTN